MNRLLFILLINISFASFSQDSLVFNNGRIRKVNIIKVDDSKKEIIIEKGKSEDVIPFDELLEFKHQGQWNYRLENNEFEERSSSSFKIRPSFFRSEPNYKYFPFSVGFSYAFVPNSFQKWNTYMFFQKNEVFRIEPEYAINNRISLKVPVVIGLNTDEPVIGPYENDYFYGGSSTGNSSRRFSTLDHYFVVEPGLENPPVLNRANYSDSYYDVHLHSRELIYQVGVSAKMYPFGRTKNAWFISPSINFGQFDTHKTTYYIDFDSTYNTNYGSYWAPVYERAVSERKPFKFIRVEFLTGLEFNWTHILNFSLECGLSSKALPLNQEADDVYIRTGNDDYFLAGNTTYYKDVRLWGITAINRFSIVIKIGENRK